MKVTPYWITEQLAIVPRPRGGDWLDDEMIALREAGINVVVSMLELHESAELGLVEERDAARRAQLGFINFPIQDRSVPSDARSFEDFLARLETHMQQDDRIGIHCRACIGRASIASASLLIRSGFLPQNVWAKIATARGCAVPDTDEQRAWVEGHVRRNS